VTAKQNIQHKSGFVKRGSYRSRYSEVRAAIVPDRYYAIAELNRIGISRMTVRREYDAGRLIRLPNHKLFRGEDVLRWLDGKMRVN